MKGSSGLIGKKVEVEVQESINPVLGALFQEWFLFSVASRPLPRCAAAEFEPPCAHQL